VLSVESLSAPTRIFRSVDAPNTTNVYGVETMKKLGRKKKIEMIHLASSLVNSLVDLLYCLRDHGYLDQSDINSIIEELYGTLKPVFKAERRALER